MRGWGRYFALQFKSRTGISLGLFIWTIAAFSSLTVAIGFIVAAGFIAVAETYSPLTAALAFGAGFLLVAAIAIAGSVWSRRRTVERAQLALATTPNPLWLEPRLLAATIDVTRMLGWRRIAPLLVVGVVAAIAGNRWIGRDRPSLSATG